MSNIAKKLFIFIIPKLPNWFVNWLIKISSRKVKPLEGSPDVFLERAYKSPLNLDGCERWREFVVGSIKGIYFVEDKSYNIVAVQNTKPSNGHFDKFLEWFERSAKRDNYCLRFLETNNPKLTKRLLGIGYSQVNNILYKNFNEKTKA